MSQNKTFIVSLFGWLGVGIFWLLATRNHHPTFLLAVIVTASLIIAYAAVAYLNHLFLIPMYWTKSYYKIYFFCLLMAMICFTGLGLTVIRFSYWTLNGPDPDPYGVYRHFAIDFFGMAVHLLGAALVVLSYNWGFKITASLQSK